MYRLLIIGRPAEDWAARLGRVMGDDVDIDTARLPSAGIRQFESTPADLIIIADDSGGSRIEVLARAIRKRPLGQLVPLLLLCPLPDQSEADDRIEELELVGWHRPETSPSEVVATLETALEADLRSPGEDSDSTDHRQGDEEPAAPEAVDDDGSASYFDGDVVLEPMDEPSQSRRIDRKSIFRSPGAQRDGDAASVTSEEIEQKLDAVRHDDYYAVLEVRRGAESQTVREAFHHHYARFNPDALDFELVRNYQDEIDEIRDALEDAFAVLGDPDLRQAYLEYTIK